ncbi:MAG: hypothetical protein KatS3mg129_2970 [Leptospiraceae bacterium]|nr:MAG: hypothetical protein KatS3mg129_2970 [Leptospiraceae bacterium]
MEIIQYNIEPIKESKRLWDYVKDPKIITNFILVKLNKHSLYLKNSIPPAEFTPTEEKEGGIEFYFNPSIKLQEHVILYLDLKRHLEFHFQLIKEISPGRAILKPEELKVSKFQRRYHRIPIKDDEVIANNFRLSKNKISTNNIQFQITAKVIFPQIEEKYKDQFPGMKLLLSNAENLPEEIKKQEINTPQIIKINIKYVFVYPIVVYQKNKFVPLIYILFPYSSSPPTEDKKTQILIELEKIADETYEKMIEANTTLIKKKQRVVNISEGGVALEITDEELKSLIPYQENIIFDLVFKLVAPIRMDGEIRYIHKLKKEEKESLLVGIDFTGEGYTDFRKKNSELLKNLISKLNSK